MTAVPNPLTPKDPTTKTVGISPKAIGALLYPIFGTFVTTVMSAIVSGQFNKAEFIIAAVGFGGSVLSALGAFISKPGNVTTK